MTMKAIILTAYGPPEVLQLQEMEKPVPKNNEVLIRIRAASVNYGDLLARNFKAVTPDKFNMLGLFWFFAKIFFGFKKPKIKVLGSEFAGIIESIGSEVQQFTQGDQVFGYLGQHMGTYAEYLCMPETGCLTTKPSNIIFEEAAVAPYGAMMALALLRNVDIQQRTKVLIIGASGGIGSAAVQIAKYSGAEVTGVCGAPRLEFVKSLGADHVIDYAKDDFTDNNKSYDIIFDVLGKSSFAQCKNSLTHNGVYLLASFKSKQLLQMLWTSFTGAKKVICSLAPGSIEDLRSVKELIQEEKIKLIVDKSFPMECTADAHRYAESGLKQGNIAITIK